MYVLIAELIVLAILDLAVKTGHLHVMYVMPPKKKKQDSSKRLKIMVTNGMQKQRLWRS